MECRPVAVSLLCLVAVAGLPAATSALAIYGYAGSPFAVVDDATPPEGTDTTSMSITGEFTLDAPLAPDLALTDIRDSVTGYTFSDGRNILTDTTSTIGSFRVATDGSGTISAWHISVLRDFPAAPAVGDQRWVVETTSITFLPQDRGSILECVDASDCLASPSLDAGLVNESPGTWTVVPEPSTGGLLGTGLLVLGAGRRPAA